MGRASEDAADEVLVARRRYAGQSARERSVADNRGFCVQPAGRELLSLNAAWDVGSTTGMKFFESAPVLAAALRN